MVFSLSSLEGGKESVREVAALAEKLRKNHSESLSSFPLTAALISQIKVLTFSFVLRKKKILMFSS